jgi:hypothetical protein
MLDLRKTRSATSVRPRGIWGLASPDANGTAVPDYADPEPDGDPGNVAL